MCLARGAEGLALGGLPRRAGGAASPQRGGTDLDMAQRQNSASDQPGPLPSVSSAPLVRPIARLPHG